jgi:NDP-sugar pyrophosphorylase family protein
LRAVIIGTRLYPQPFPGSAESVGPLPPLLDRPFLQHVVESVIVAGASEIDLVLGESSRAVKDLLGNGSRWGVSVRYHEARGGTSVYGAIPTTQTNGFGEPVLLAHTHVLPQVKLERITNGRLPLFLCWKDSKASWTGWAVLQAAALDTLRRASSAQDFFERYLRAGDVKLSSHPAIEEVAKPLFLDSYPELIAAHLSVLSDQHRGLLLTGRELFPGVRLSRGVVINRTARLVAPVFIGENCRVGEYCQIGPGASLGKDCIIGDLTTITDSVICAGSYVGQGLELRHVYVEGSRLVNARLRAEIDDVDDVLLGNLYGSSGNPTKKPASWTR